MKSWMQQAREAAGLTTMLTIDELVALSFELNDESRRIIVEGVRSAIL